VVGAIVLVLVLVFGAVSAGVGVMSLRGDEVIAARRGGRSEWDPRVLDLVEFVADERGLEFDHPVPVDFLTAEEYSEAARVDADDLTRGQEQDMADQLGILRSFGLVEGDVDLLAAGNDLADQGTLAYFDPVVDRIVVRGTEVTLDLEVTLVHELTHALQFQHHPELFQYGGETNGETFAADAVVEGDAMRIEYAYVDSLSRQEQREYEDLYADQFEETDAALVGVPESLVASFSAPYTLGHPFVDLLDSIDAAAVEDAFIDPPMSEEQLLDPFRYLAGDEPEPLDPPETPDGAEFVLDGDFGAVGWMVVLAERIDPFDAFDAAAGWRGDGYTTYELEGRVCTDAVIAGDSAADTDELERAFEAWAAALPSVDPTVRRAGDTVTVSACDPGPEASLDLTGHGARALTIPATRAFIGSDGLAYGDTEEVSRCVADDLVRRYTLDEMESPEIPADAADRLDASLEACGV
jgi:hypothetical protein